LVEIDSSCSDSEVLKFYCTRRNTNKLV